MNNSINSRTYKMGMYFLSTFLFMGVLNSDRLFAQNSRIELNQQDLSESIVEAVQTHFPNSSGITWYAFDRSANNWTIIKTHQNAEGITPDYYIATHKGENFNTRAVYNRKGKLLKANTTINNMTLPAMISNKVTADYPEWEIIGNTIFIRNFDENKRYYVVQIQNNNRKQNLKYDVAGNKLRSRNI